MAVKKGNEFLSDVSLKHLEKFYKEEKNAKSKIRLQCAILRKNGKGIPFIAEATNKPATTVSDILNRFEKRGIKGKDAIKQKGQPSKLSKTKRVKLKKILSQSPEKIGLPFVVWTTKLVGYVLHKFFKVEYTLRHAQNLLKSLGFSLQKPRPEHVKANKALQAHFKKNFDADLKVSKLGDMRSSFWTKAPSASNLTQSQDGT